jgi:hypothetical protein
MTCCVQSRRHQARGGSSVIEPRRAQLIFGDGLITEEVNDLREDSMRRLDEIPRSTRSDRMILTCWPLFAWRN